jgi:4'-phosphopantetheinyl transferase EntD
LGSIAHTDELLVVTAGLRSPRLDALGVDLERLPLTADAADAMHLCLTAREVDRLMCVEDGLVTGFSAKEALFKCLSAEAGRYFDFLEAEIVDVDPVSQELRLQLLVDLSPRLPRGKALRVAWRRLEGHVWTGVVWRDCR